jgi:hypothetical protein
MNGRIVRVLLSAGLLVISSSSLFAQERWVYLYDNPGNGRGEASSIVAGPSGDIYAAGWTGNDFTVVNLTDSGVERWVYQYNGPENGPDRANSIMVGSDGNIYAAGLSTGIGTHYDFTVVSLTDSGVERWVYRYDGPGDYWDEASSIIMGSDGNIYAAGWSTGIATQCDFTVVSLTNLGEERWVYRYDGFASSNDEAFSIVAGSDGTLYAAGLSAEGDTTADLTVISLSSLGVECWVYSYDGPASYNDVARSIIMGSDGNLYAAGWSTGVGTDQDFTALSLTDSGAERWVYRYDGPASDYDGALSIIMGSDGNLYAAGWSTGVGTDLDFTALSLTDSGVERWVYRYDGPAGWGDCACSIVTGSGNDLYVAGYSVASATSSDFTVVSLTNSGTEGWVYRYDGPVGLYDQALSVVMGSDSNLYAAGWSLVQRAYGDTCPDFTVVSLTAQMGVGEGMNRPSAPAPLLSQNSPNPFHHSTVTSYSLPQASNVTLTIHDITGRLVEMLVNETQRPGIHQVGWNRKDNPSGVYFYRLKAGEFVETRKMVVVE